MDSPCLSGTPAPGLNLLLPTTEFSEVNYLCPQCHRQFSGWQRFSSHLTSSLHAVTACGECHRQFPALEKEIDCIVSHQRETQHFSLTRPVMLEADLRLSNPDPLTPTLAQFVCDCSRVFLTQSHLVTHLQEERFRRRASELKSSDDEESSDTHWAWLRPDLRRISTLLGGKHSESDAAPSDESARVSCVNCGFSIVASLWSRQSAAEHDATCSSPALTVADISMSSFALRFPAVASAASAVPIQARPSHGIMYQCPECFFIFLSWARMEKHLTQTKHSLRFCRECHAHLNPRGQLQARDHTEITGHVDFIGEHRSKKDYEVIVNTFDPAMVQIVDVALPSVQSQTLQERICFQCPAPSCFELFVTMPELEEHFRETRHSVMFCDVCKDHVKISTPRRSGVVTHEHPIKVKGGKSSAPSTPPSPASEDPGEGNEGSFTLRRGDDFRVVTSNSEMIRRFGHRFVECSMCHLAVEVERHKAHYESTECEGVWARTFLQQQGQAASKS
jgi:hypothetical protein